MGTLGGGTRREEGGVLKKSLRRYFVFNDLGLLISDEWTRINGICLYMNSPSHNWLILAEGTFIVREFFTASVQCIYIIQAVVDGDSR